MPARRTYDRGDKVRASVAFTSAAGAAVDPAAVTCRVKNPEGTDSTYVYGTNAELVRDSQGNYHLDIDANVEGLWTYRFEGTGTNQGAGEGEFTVRDSAFY